MRTSISFGGAGGTGEDWSDVVEYVREAERLGVDFAWSAEAWGQDAVTAVAYLAAVTSRIRLGTGIMQITARVPAMMAMTALSLDRMTGGRFALGLGVSGPQVVEGMHGVRFNRPLGRLRETLDIVEMALRGERIAYEGRHFTLPLPDGEGKAIALSMTPRPELPIYLATLAPRSLELTGERAQGWLGTSFVPERAEVFFTPIARGAARAGRTLCGSRPPGGRPGPRLQTTWKRTVATLKPDDGVPARRDGLRDHELLQRRLAPGGVGGRGPHGAAAVARPPPGRGGRRGAGRPHPAQQSRRNPGHGARTHPASS